MEINVNDVLLSGGGLTALIALFYTIINNTRKEKRDKAQAVDLRFSSLEKCTNDLKESVKRVHIRVDTLDHDQQKIERQIEKDIGEVKSSITRLTDLILRVLKKQE